MSDYVRTKAIRYLPNEGDLLAVGAVGDFWVLEESFPEEYRKYNAGNLKETVLQSETMNKQVLFHS